MTTELFVAVELADLTGSRNFSCGLCVSGNVHARQYSYDRLISLCRPNLSDTADKIALVLGPARLQDSFGWKTYHLKKMFDAKC